MNLKDLIEELCKDSGTRNAIHADHAKMERKEKETALVRLDMVSHNILTLAAFLNTSPAVREADPLVRQILCLAKQTQIPTIDAADIPEFGETKLDCLLQNLSEFLTKAEKTAAA